MKKILILGLLGLSSAFGANVAQYISLGQGQDYTLTNLGTSESLVSSTDVLIMFFWSAATGLPPGGITAKLNFSATSNTLATVDGSGNIAEQNWTGSFTIKTLTNQNLLSATFGPTGLFGGAGTQGSFTDSAPPQPEVVFTSDFLDFSNTSQRGLSLSFSNYQVGANPASLTLNPNGEPNTGTYAGTGTFSATPLPVSAPEPSSLALIGSGLIGLSMCFRRRRA